MVITFKQQIAIDIAAVHLNSDEFATAMTYINSAGTQTAIKGKIEPIVEVMPFEVGLQADVQNVIINRAVISAPARGDTITIASVVWRVCAITGNEYLWTIQISTDSRLS